MTDDQLISELRKRYDLAKNREVVLQIHLFAIEYAGELEGHSANEIAELATGHRSYGTEIRKGIRLSRFVELKQGAER